MLSLDQTFLRRSLGIIFVSIFSTLLACTSSPPTKAPTDTSQNSPPTESAPLTTEYTLNHQGLERIFRIHQPVPTPRKSQKIPLVILLHGGSLSMRKALSGPVAVTRRWVDLSDQEGFLLAVPNAMNLKERDPKSDNQHWNDCRASETEKRLGAADDVGFIKKLIAWTVENENVDAKKVFVTGASNGGMMSFRLATEVPELFAAFAAEVANEPIPSECPRPKKPVNLLIMNGTADPIMPWAGEKNLQSQEKVPSLSAEATRDLWLKVNGSNLKKAVTTELPRLSDSGDLSKPSSAQRKPAATRFHYPGKADLVFYRVEDGGHAPPSRKYFVPPKIEKALLGAQNHDFEGADEIWNFFKTYL